MVLKIILPAQQTLVIFLLRATAAELFCNVSIQIPTQEAFFQVRQAAPAFQLTYHEICTSLQKEKPLQMTKGSNKHPLMINFSKKVENSSISLSLMDCHKAGFCTWKTEPKLPGLSVQTSCSATRGHKWLKNSALKKWPRYSICNMSLT